MADDFKVLPVKINGHIVGEARVSSDGEIVNAELNAEAAGILSRWIDYGLTDSISIRPNRLSAVPETKENNNNGS